MLRIFKFIIYKDFFYNNYFKYNSMIFTNKQISNKIIKSIEYYGYCKPAYSEGEYVWVCSKSLYLIPYLTFKDMEYSIMYYLDLLNENYNAENIYNKFREKNYEER